MLELFVKATLLLVLALVVSGLLPRAWSTQRHRVLLVALLTLPLLPLFSLIPTELSLRYPEVSPTLEPPTLDRAKLSPPPAELSLSAPSLSSKPHPLSFVFPGVWIVGTLILLLRLLADQRALSQLLKTATRAPFPVEARFPIWLTAQPTVPLACGIHRPRILLPESACDWEEERLQAVLLHETAHLHRRDPLWQCVTELIRAVFWFHPLVWMAVFRLRQEAESACDRHVLANGIAPDRYAHHLLEIVKMLKNRPVAPAMAHTPRLEGRVRSILGYLPTRPARGIGVGLVLAGLATVPLLAARSTPLPQKAAETLTTPVVITKQSPAPSVQAPKNAPAKVRVQRVAKAQADAALIEKRLRNDALLAEARAKQSRKQEQERKLRELRLEPLREELDELKIKLRDLDSRLTDKKLELAALDREKIAQQEAAGLIAPGQVESIDKQIVVLQKMIEETRQKRELLRVELLDRSSAH